MRRKSMLIVLLSVLLLVLGGCAKNIVNEASEDLLDLDQLEAKAVQIQRTHTVSEIQQSLHQLAPVFAKSLQEDQALKNLLAVEVGKKFDGDYDVLYDMISSKRAQNGMSLQNKLIKTAQAVQSDISVATLVNSIPYFNISIPVHFDQWSSYDGPIYVVPLRYDVDDQAIETVVGYDANGNTKTFSTATPPEFPVVVLGINERINMLKRQQEQPATLEPGMVSTQVVMHEETLRGLKIEGSYDLWPRGNPELYILYAVGEHVVEQKNIYPDVDVEGSWYSFNQILFAFPKVTSNTYWKLEAWDEDATASTSYMVSDSFTTGGVNYKISGSFLKDSADDLIGSTLIYSYRSLPLVGWTENTAGGLGIRLGYKETLY